MSWTIASVSWGKDSLAMLHLLIERGTPPDEVVFYDTGAEFNAMSAPNSARSIVSVADRDLSA